MGVTLTTSARNAAANAVCDLLDAGAGPGTIELQTGGGVEVATLTMNDPAFGSPVAGVKTLDVAPEVQDTSATGGTATVAVFKDSNGTEAFRCTVGAAGGGGDIDITADNVIGAGETVRLDALTYTQPAS